MQAKIANIVSCYYLGKETLTSCIYSCGYKKTYTILGLVRKSFIGDFDINCTGNVLIKNVELVEQKMHYSYSQMISSFHQNLRKFKNKLLFLPSSAKVHFFPGTYYCLLANTNSWTSLWHLLSLIESAASIQKYYLRISDNFPEKFYFSQRTISILMSSHRALEALLICFRRKWFVVI